MQNTFEDTICALATPVGGALAVIRLSGSSAITIADSIFRSASGRPLAEAKANTLHYGEIVNAESQSSTLSPIDDVVVSVFHAPHSYTGEDSVEISCHGSRYVIREILNLLQANGARQAEPGEYTRRAYLNGKMDLSQAEAVADLIASANRASHDLAISQLKGHVRTALSDMRERLQKLTALLELELDFSDHEDLEFADRTELLDLAHDIESRLTRLADTYRTGRAIKEGVPVAIVGAPNVGKSTLLNRLLGEDRAIVSDIPGTTRDSIEDTVDIGGITFRFIDTAGLRHTDDRVEQIGIDRSYQAIDRAAIVILLYDQPSALSPLSSIPSSSQSSSSSSLTFAPSCAMPFMASESSSSLFKGKRVIPVRSKADLASTPILENELSVSAKTGFGIDSLKATLKEAADIPQIHEGDPVITSARQYALLEEALTGLRRVITGLGGSPQSHPTILNTQTSTDLVAEDLRFVIDRLGEVTGVERVTPASTLNLIFKEFCVGK